MASSTLAIPTAYHKATGILRKAKTESTNVRSEDELLKFFLHGSYDVQRGGSSNVTTIVDDSTKTNSIQDDSKSNKTTNNDEKKSKSRLMFEETYMINISVKQPDALPTSKQIDVRIEKTPSDGSTIKQEKVDDDEISSVFDEDENDEIESVVFNEIPSTPNERPSTPLTLADMISKTLTTIPTGTNVTEPMKKNWFPENSNEIKTVKTQDEIKLVENRQKPPTKTTSLTTSRSEDEKLIQYLDYLETKEDSNVKNKKIETKKISNEPIPIIDLEGLCRSLTVNDLKDESIRKKMFELKILIDERHKKVENPNCLVKNRKGALPVLIAMPAARELRNDQRRTTNGPSSNLLQSKTLNNFHKNSVPSYQQIGSNVKTTPLNPVVLTRRVVHQFSSNNVNRKVQFT